MPLPVLARSWTRLAGRPALMGAAIAALAVASAALAAALAGKPQPSVHDEFSYLLAADTFAHFRLANEPHPHWPFFESMHIVHDPAYASMYPPGQGMMLGAGQIITGDPVAGVWISAALMAVVIYWMLLGWLPVRWAALGGLLVVLKFIVLGRAAPPAVGGYWTQSYQGGAVAAIGGALLFGALIRIIRPPLPLGEGWGEGKQTAGDRNPVGTGNLDASDNAALTPALSQGERGQEKPSPRHALLLALGVAILANTRPFEGFLISLPAAIVLLVWLCRRRGAALRQALVRVVAPAAAVLVLMIAFMGVYNAQVTGKATLMPWKHHHDQYCTFPIFLWQKPKAGPGLPWKHEVMKDFHGIWEVDLWNRHRSAWGLTIESARKLRILWAFYVAPLPRPDAPIEFDVAGDGGGGGIAMWFKKVFTGMSATEYALGLLLTLPLVALPWVLRNRWMLLAAVTCGLVVAGNMITVVTFPHYAAPMTGLLVLLLTQCLRCTSSRWPRIGPAVVAGVLLISCVAFAGGFVPSWRQGDRQWHLERARVQRELEQRDGGHLVVVRYGPSPGHSMQNEWVYNAADIDGAKVVWARDMGDAKNRELLDYFNNRHHWLLHITNDQATQQLAPYDARKANP